MKCQYCAQDTPDASSFCMHCGKTIDPRFAQLEAKLADLLEERIQTIIKTQYKESKVLEVEVAEGVAKRLTDWGKAVGFLVAVPLGILALVLAILGVHSYTGFVEKVNAQRKALESKGEELVQVAVTNAKTRLDEEVAKQVAEIQARRENLLREVDTRVAQNPEVKRLAEEIKALKFEIETDATIAPGTAQKIDQELQNFQTYLRSVGFQANTKVRFKFAKLDGTATATSSMGDPMEVTMIPRLASSTDNALQVYMKSVLQSEGQKTLADPSDGGDRMIRTIQWGLSKYFPCSFHNRSVFMTDISTSESENLEIEGTLELRTLDTNDEEGTLYGDDAIRWAAFFWDIRKLLGAKNADQLIHLTWGRLSSSLTPNQQRAMIKETLLREVSALNGGQFVSALNGICRKRGL